MTYRLVFSRSLGVLWGIGFLVLGVYIYSIEDIGEFSFNVSAASLLALLARGGAEREIYLVDGENVGSLILAAMFRLLIFCIVGKATLGISWIVLSASLLIMVSFMLVEHLKASGETNWAQGLTGIYQILAILFGFTFNFEISASLLLALLVQTIFVLIVSLIKTKLEFKLLGIESFLFNNEGLKIIGVIWFLNNGIYLCLKYILNAHQFGLLSIGMRVFNFLLFFNSIRENRILQKASEEDFKIKRMLSFFSLIVLVFVLVIYLFDLQFLSNLFKVETNTFNIIILIASVIGFLRTIEVKIHLELIKGFARLGPFILSALIWVILSLLTVQILPSTLGICIISMGGVLGSNFIYRMLLR